MVTDLIANGCALGLNQDRQPSLLCCPITVQANGN